MKAACCKCGRLLWEGDPCEVIQAVEDATTHGAWEGGIQVAFHQDPRAVRATDNADEVPVRVTVVSMLRCPPCRGLTSWPVCP